jgi:SNF2 family DNA or RNA helicase
MAATVMEPAWHLAYPEKPYAVQIEALRKSEGHDKFGYFLEMGLGKTSLVLNDYVDRLIDNTTVFVACPNSFKADWASAPVDHGLDFSSSLWPDQQFKIGTVSRPHFNIINYEALRGRGYDAVREIVDKVPSVFVVDESSAVKNFQSQTSRAILDLSKRFKHERLLNGTPMTQNVMDLFTQLKCLNELDGVNPYQFKHRHAVVGGWMGKQIIGVKNEEELHKILDRCSFRALKKDWSDLPEKIYRPMRLEMTNNQRKHYKDMLQDFYTMVQGEEFTAEMVITQMDKLRQITSGLIMDGDKFKLIDPIAQNPKAKAASDIIETGSSKVIVVHFYRQMGFELLDYFDKKGYNPSYIRGGMKPEALICEKHKFNNDPSSRVIVCQIQSAYQAHTLLGQEGNDRCHVTFFHDQTFSLLQRAQMEDRNHRGAQDRAVLYYDPIMSSVDEAQVGALIKKKNLAEMVVDAVRATRH